MPKSIRYEALDGEGEPTIWEQGHGKQPQPIMRRCDLKPEVRDFFWPLIVQAVCARPGFSCGRCGDDSEPADCPDRHTFDDHGLCCMGTCGACQHRIDQGETT